MSRWQRVIKTDGDRTLTAHWCMRAPVGMRIEFKEAKRTNDQNSLLWALLTDVSQQLSWHGQRLTPDDWKLVFLDALKREMRIVPNIAGNGFVNLGRSSSDLSKAEFSDLIEVIRAFGAEHGVKFQDEEKAA